MIQKKISRKEYIESNEEYLFYKLFKNETIQFYFNDENNVSILNLYPNKLNEIDFNNMISYFNILKSERFLFFIFPVNEAFFSINTEIIKCNNNISWYDFSNNSNDFEDKLNEFIPNDFVFISNNGKLGKISINDYYINSIGLEFDIYKTNLINFKIIKPYLENDYGKLLKVEGEILDKLKYIFPKSLFYNTYIFEKSVDWFSNNYKL